ncbi:MAG: divergent polysaccharide deacetylase family protein [Desulfobacterales bacterium]|nr:divergent polysaccharide deacetylase family protein [Desulfobacterales bacterium]
MNRRQFLLRTSTSLAASLASSLGATVGISRAAGMPIEQRQQAEIAIIVDDIGFSRSRAHHFLALDIPLTFSILPQVPFTRELAETLHAAGHEIMLHQPMEPVNNSYNPGPGALYTADRQQEIVTAIERNISEIPHITGVNNHMGSKFTANSEKMRQALGVVKSKELFFVDSMTTRRSKGFPTANRLGITTARRNIFLDNRLTVPAILVQLDKLQKVALKTGRALAIGHPFPQTATAIQLFNRENKKAGVKFVHVSKVL